MEESMTRIEEYADGDSRGSEKNQIADILLEHGELIIALELILAGIISGYTLYTGVFQ